MKREVVKVLLICLLIAAAPAMVAQQITGTVVEENGGKALQSANVVLNPGKLGVVTDSNGEFRFRDVPAGKYILQVSMVGFLARTQDIIVRENDNLELVVSLQQDIRKIDELVVLGNFSQTAIMEDPVREQASIMPAFSNVTKLQMGKQGAVTLVDALKYTPGGWTETRGRKVKQFVSLRGQKYPYPSYSVNGIWQKEFQEMPYFFNSMNIEEVQIIRSSSALLKSLSALSGVIDVKTKQPGINEVNIFARYGQLNSYYTGASYGNTTDKVSYHFGINGSGTSGPENRNGKEEIYNAFGYFDWKLSEKLSWSANLFYLDGMRQLVQAVEPAGSKFRNQKELYDPIKNLLAAFSLKYKSGGKFTSELSLNYARRNPGYQSENLENGVITQYEETDWEISINQINAVALSESNTFRFGALYNYWEAPEGKRYYYGKKAEVHTVSGVISDQHDFGRLLFDAGFRLTQEYYAEWGGFSIEGSGSSFSMVEPIVDEWQVPVWQATSGLSYSLKGNSSMHLSVAAGMVNPRKGALNEAGETPDNETRVNLDLGHVKNFERGGKFSLVTFLVNRRKAIEYSGNTRELNENEIIELYQNTDKRNYGVEAEFKSAILHKTISFFSNLAFMKGEVDDEGNWKDDDEMPNFIANAGVNLQRDRFDVNAYFHYTGAYKNDRFVSKDYIDEFGKAPLGNFLTFDTTLGYNLGKKRNARIFVEGKNLFDIKYQTVPGYPDFGRIVSLGLMYNYKSKNAISKGDI